VRDLAYHTAGPVRIVGSYSFLVKGLGNIVKGADYINIRPDCTTKAVNQI